MPQLEVAFLPTSRIAFLSIRVWNINHLGKRIYTLFDLPHWAFYFHPATFCQINILTWTFESGSCGWAVDLPSRSKVRGIINLEFKKSELIYLKISIWQKCAIFHASMTKSRILDGHNLCPQNFQLGRPLRVSFRIRSSDCQKIPII